MEAIRALKRRLSDIVYRQLVADQKRRRPDMKKTDGEGQTGTATGSSAAGYNPKVDDSEKSLPGPATCSLRPQPSLAQTPFSLRSRRPVTAPRRSRGQARSA